MLKAHNNQALENLAKTADVSTEEMSKMLVDYFTSREYLYRDDHGVTVEQIIENEGLAPHEVCAEISEKFTTESMAEIQTIMFVSASDMYCDCCGCSYGEPDEAEYEEARFRGDYMTPPDNDVCIYARYICADCGNETITNGEELN